MICMGEERKRGREEERKRGRKEERMEELNPNQKREGFGYGHCKQVAGGWRNGILSTPPPLPPFPLPP